jgi:exopolyphosphatase/guanosine-5'-triphosphate,3'-diphosphate pyrophosphatase
MRYAAIDIGSNAVRLLISDVISGQEKVLFNKVQFVRVPLRLGSSVFTNHRISDTNIIELEKTMIAFKALMDVYHVISYMACATAAMREAENGAEITKYILKKTGIDIKIIDGKKEARLIHNTHIAEELNGHLSYLYIDVGGGSTEVTLFSDNEIIASNSFQIGTVRILCGMDVDAVTKQMKHWLKKHIADKQDIIGIGTGGNINKIFKLSGKKENKTLSRNEIKKIYNHLSQFTLEERINILGLNEDRADVILPAAKIFLNITKWAGINEMIVPKLGLADGIVHALYEQHQANK